MFIGGAGGGVGPVGGGFPFPNIFLIIHINITRSNRKEIPAITYFTIFWPAPWDWGGKVWKTKGVGDSRGSKTSGVAVAKNVEIGDFVAFMVGFGVGFGVGDNVGEGVWVGLGLDVPPGVAEAEGDGVWSIPPTAEIVYEPPSPVPPERS